MSRSRCLRAISTCRRISFLTGNAERRSREVRLYGCYPSFSATGSMQWLSLGQGRNVCFCQIQAENKTFSLRPIRGHWLGAILDGRNLAHSGARTALLTHSGLRRSCLSVSHSEWSLIAAITWHPPTLPPLQFSIMRFSSRSRASSCASRF